MRLKDLAVGQKVWFSTSNQELRKGGGQQVTVHAIGRYTRTWEPCGSLITPTSAPGPTKVVIKLPAEDKQRGARFGAESSPQQFLVHEGGRYLMHEDEHKVHRAAAADRALVIEAHKQRGEVLKTAAFDHVKKALLTQLGLTDELVEVHLRQRHYRGDKYVPDGFFEVEVTFKPKLAKVIHSQELDDALKEYSKWKSAPVPGKDCVI